MAGESPTTLLASRVVKLPAALVLTPILILLIVPAVVGFIVTVPVPVGLIVIVALAGLIDTVEFAVNVFETVNPSVIETIPVPLARSSKSAFEITVSITLS